MKRFALVFVSCIGLLLTSAWLIMHPAGAQTMTVTCRDGSKRTCSGQSCTGADYLPNGGNGWCQCSNLAGPGRPPLQDVQDCDQ